LVCLCSNLLTLVRVPLSLHAEPAWVRALRCRAQHQQHAPSR